MATGSMLLHFASRQSARRAQHFRDRRDAITVAAHSAAAAVDTGCNTLSVPGSSTEDKAVGTMYDGEQIYKHSRHKAARLHNRLLTAPGGIHGGAQAHRVL